MPKLVKTYTEEEVGKILKDSENHNLGNEPAFIHGHAEGLHELVSVGRGRESTSAEELGDRLVVERKNITGAFDGCQVKAVTWALNCRAGQTTLGFLEPGTVKHVFCFINIVSQVFRMKSARAETPGRGKEGPVTRPVIADTTAQYIAMKLMKDGAKLHIRTAYPMDEAPGRGQRCQVFYEGGASLDQDLPV